MPFTDPPLEAQRITKQLMQSRSSQRIEKRLGREQWHGTASGAWEKIDVWTEPSAALNDINHMFRGTERDSRLGPRADRASASCRSLNSNSNSNSNLNLNLNSNLKGSASEGRSASKLVV